MSASSYTSAVLQLTCMKKYGKEADEVTVPERVSMRSNSRYVFRKNKDSIIVDALIIPNNIDLNRITYITITHNDQNVYDIPFKLISSLCPHKIQNDCTIISLNSVLGKQSEIFVIMLLFVEVSMILRTNSHQQFDFEVLLLNRIYNHTLRDQLCQSPKIVLTSDYLHVQIDNPNTNVYNVKQPYGMFLYARELSNFELELNNSTIVAYDEFTISEYCKIIHKPEWGKKHSKAVINTIGKSINMDIIQIIIGYCKRSIPLEKWTYWIPFSFGYGWSDEGIPVMEDLKNRNLTIKITAKPQINYSEESLCRGSYAYITCRNYLLMANGLSRLSL